MNKKIISLVLSSLILFPVVVFGAQNLSEVTTRVTREIDNRIDNLGRSITRVESIKRLSDTQRAQIADPLKTVVSDLTALKTKISQNQDTATTLADFKTVTQSYRVYALVMPRTAINVAGERIRHAASLLRAVKEKINARLAALPSGTDVLSVTQLLNDFDVKISEAESNVSTALNEIAQLQPDKGDETLLRANLTTLKNARDRIKSAHQSIRDARRNLGEAIKLIREIEKQ